MSRRLLGCSRGRKLCTTNLPLNGIDFESNQRNHYYQFPHDPIPDTEYHTIYITSRGLIRDRSESSSLGGGICLLAVFWHSSGNNNGSRNRSDYYDYMISGLAGPVVKFTPQLRHSVRLPFTSGPPMGCLLGDVSWTVVTMGRSI